MPAPQRWDVIGAEPGAPLASGHRSCDSDDEIRDDEIRMAAPAGSARSRRRQIRCSTVTMWWSRTRMNTSLPDQRRPSGCEGHQRPADLDDVRGQHPTRSRPDIPGVVPHARRYKEAVTGLQGPRSPALDHYLARSGDDG